LAKNKKSNTFTTTKSITKSKELIQRAQVQFPAQATDALGNVYAKYKLYTTCCYSVTTHFVSEL